MERNYFAGENVIQKVEANPNKMCSDDYVIGIYFLGCPLSLVFYKLFFSTEVNIGP
jgi:hypothetical protein